MNHERQPQNAAEARLALFELRTDAAAAWLDANLPGPGDDSPEALRVGLLRAWVDLMRGQIDGVDEAAARVQTAAGAAREASLVVEAVSLRAMAALAAGQLGAATALGRRASLMAASEKLLPEMCLANLVLARVRRHTGRPHLAARISSVIGRWAPPELRAWLAWERALAGGDAAPLTLPSPPDGGEGADPAEAAGEGSAGEGSPFAAACADLARLLATARAADRNRFAAAAAALTASVAQAAPFAGEVDALLRLADPAKSGGAAVDDWLSGGSPLPPLGLHGLCLGGAGDASAGDREDSAACVVVRPGARGRRVLRLGLERAEAQVGSAVTGDHDQSQSRTDTGLCVLGLAGPDGFSIDEFFRLVYGFPYSAALHRNILNVLVHRMRKRCDGAAEVERDGDQVRLAVHKPLAILDTRCSEPAVQRVLWLLARRGAATAKDAAQVLGIPLRTAQAVLQQLAADGSCSVTRSGKQLSYRIDDTTFSEPTPITSNPV